MARGRSNAVQQHVRRVQEAGHSNDSKELSRACIFLHMNYVDEMLHVLPFGLCLSCITKMGHLVWMLLTVPFLCVISLPNLRQGFLLRCRSCFSRVSKGNRLLLVELLIGSCLCLGLNWNRPFVLGSVDGPWASLVCLASYLRLLLLRWLLCVQYCFFKTLFMCRNHFD